MMQRDVHRRMETRTARSFREKLHCTGEGSGADGSPHASAFCACYIGQLERILALLVVPLTDRSESKLAYILVRGASSSETTEQ